MTTRIELTVTGGIEDLRVRDTIEHAVARFMEGIREGAGNNGAAAVTINDLYEFKKEVKMRPFLGREPFREHDEERVVEFTALLRFDSAPE